MAINNKEKGFLTHNSTSNTYTLKRKILSFTNKIPGHLSKPVERKLSASVSYIQQIRKWIPADSVIPIDDGDIVKSNGINLNPLALSGMLLRSRPMFFIGQRPCNSNGLTIFVCASLMQGQVENRTEIDYEKRNSIIDNINQSYSGYNINYRAEQETKVKNRREMDRNEEYGLTPYQTREILFYKTDNGEVQVEILLYQENLWLTQAKMAELFEVQKAAISKHLKNIFESGEWQEEAVGAYS